MPEPLDLLADVGLCNKDFELLEQLWDLDDPCEILLKCEQADAEEGRTPGTTLELYYASMTNTEGRKA